MYRYSILYPVCCCEWGSTNSISTIWLHLICFCSGMSVCVVIKSGFKGCFTASYIIHFALVSFLFPRSRSVGSISCSLWKLLWCYIVCRLFHGNVSSSWWGWGFLWRHGCCVYNWLYVTSPHSSDSLTCRAIAWFFLGRNAFFQDPFVLIRCYAFHSGTETNQMKCTHSFRNRNKSNATKLSKYYWYCLIHNNKPDIKWNIYTSARSYECGSGRCNLCLEEKIAILKSDKETTLNKRSEILSKCRHKNKFKLRNFKGW